MSQAYPYIVLAAILAGIEHGISHKLDPGSAAEGNCDASDAPKVPTAWVNALAQFETSKTVADAFGPAFQKVYAQMKQAERIAFERVVTELDYQWYARVA